MSFPAPQWAFAAQAIDSARDPHLAPGVHFRLLFSQGLGLPLVPFQVRRIELGKGAAKARTRTDGIRWVDSRGMVLTPPFNVVPDNPVTGWIATGTGAVCCWIEVLAWPTGDTGPGGPWPGFPVEASNTKPQPVEREPETRSEQTGFGPLGYLGRSLELPRDMTKDVRSGLHVSAVVATPRGPGIVASRSEPSYELAASRIDRVVVSGRGVVNGARWLDASGYGEFNDEYWRLLALPLEYGARYMGVGSADRLAQDRVMRGAPLRESLMDAPDVANPASAPLIIPPDVVEWERIEKRRPPVMDYLLRLIDDLSEPQHLLSDSQEVFDENGRRVGNFDTNLLGALHNLALDPGFARLLGFADVDETVAGWPDGEVIAYVIRGIWDARALRVGELARRLIPQSAFVPRDFVRVKLPEAAGETLLDIFAVACATMGLPPDRPRPPTLGAPVPGPWTPVLPPAAEREIRVPAASLRPGAMVAFARRLGLTVTPLNEPGPDGRCLPTSPAMPGNSTDPSQGIFYDRHAPPDVVSYRIAQTDWFGRWSDWSEAMAPAGVRPRPPRPAPQLFYDPPTFSTTPVPNGPLSGRVRVRVPVPNPASIAPGSLPLTMLRVTLDGVTTDHMISAAPDTDMEVTFTGPALARCGRSTLRLVTAWIDSVGAVSDPSPQIERDIADPRPPEHVSLPSTLNYGSRPDVTGKSRIDLRWTTTSAQRRFRVFTSDETSLKTRLERMVLRNEPRKATAQSILAAVAAASNAPDRAAVYVANKRFFTRDMFELLTADPLETGSFTHRVSGSLRVLLFYRVVAVSDSNVEASFADSPLTPFGIPNSGAPSTPVLEVKLHPKSSRIALVRIKVPAGAVQAVEFRLRRSKAQSHNALAMPIVTTGMVPALWLTPPPPGEPNTEMQTLVVADRGTSEVEPSGTLALWHTYSWCAEVRGAPEPGGGPDGEWSLPSPAVALTIVPPDPPDAATNLSITRAGMGVVVQMEHPDPLNSGSLGEYHIDLYARPPGGDERFVASLSADAPVASGGRNPDRTGQFTFNVAGPVAPGTTFRAIVSDPMGRLSMPSASVQAP